MIHRGYFGWLSAFMMWGAPPGKREKDSIGRSYGCITEVCFCYWWLHLLCFAPLGVEKQHLPNGLSILHARSCKLLQVIFVFMKGFPVLWETWVSCQEEISYIDAPNPPWELPPWGYVRQPNDASSRKIGQHLGLATCKMLVVLAIGQ